MNNQQAFDKVRMHLMDQGVKATDSHGHCQYRGDNGTMCAIGCLIPNWRYRKKFDDFTFGIDRLQKLVPPISRLNSSLLNALQFIHDDENVEDWAEELEKVRIKFKLEVSDEK